MIGCASALMCLSLAACGGKAVVTTNGGKITQSQFYNKMKNTQNGKDVLRQMILDKLLEKDYGSDVKNSQINDEINQYKEEYGSQFNMLLQQQGITSTQLKKNMRSKLLLREAVKHNIDFTKPVLKKQFKSFEPKVSVDQILVSNKTKAETVESKLKSGDSFKSLAKEYSKDTATKDKSGRLTPFDNTAKLSKAFKKAAFKLDNGEYTKTPVKTKYGYQIIKMVDKPTKGTYKDHVSTLKDQITDKRMENATTVKKVVAKILRKGDVNIQDSDLKNILANYMS